MRGLLQKFTPIVFAAFFVVASSIASKPALAWGHLAYLREEPYLRVSLMTAVLQTGEIRYAVLVRNDPQSETYATEESISEQVEFALRLWLKPLEQLGIRGTRILRVSPQGPNFNLLIDLGQDKITPEHRACQSPETSTCDPYSYVRINSSHVYNSGGQKYRTLDTAIYSKSCGSLNELLTELSIDEPSDTHEAGCALETDHLELFHSTYPTLLHELGHSFGLADTYEGQVEKQIDSEFRSGKHPDSIMKTASYFHLTDDDREGILSLARRFQKAP